MFDVTDGGSRDLEPLGDVAMGQPHPSQVPNGMNVSFGQTSGMVLLTANTATVLAAPALPIPVSRVIGRRS